MKYHLMYLKKIYVLFIIKINCCKNILLVLGETKYM